MNIELIIKLVITFIAFAVLISGLTSLFWPEIIRLMKTFRNEPDMDETTTGDVYDLRKGK
jgi:hypothetical protein